MFSPYLLQNFKIIKSRSTASLQLYAYILSRLFQNALKSFDQSHSFSICALGWANERVRFSHIFTSIPRGTDEKTMALIKWLKCILKHPSCLCVPTEVSNRSLSAKNQSWSSDHAELKSFVGIAISCIQLKICKLKSLLMFLHRL